MRDPASTVEAHLAVWADVISFLLLGITILIADGINPRRRVWGRSPLCNTLLIPFLSINIIYSAGRFIAEGILVEAGPREFLLLSIVYCLRWVWLYVKISRSDSRSARAFKVARKLRELKMIRLGKSTSPERVGRAELVIRRGARIAKGTPYWRGFEEHVEYIERKDTFKVILVQPDLHSTELDEIGTVNFRNKLETANPDQLYKLFYDLVMTVRGRNDDFPINYGPFLEATGAPVTADTGQAIKVGAVDESDLGDVARKVAADAFYYISHTGERVVCRTPWHVELINQCLEDAVTNYFESDSHA